MPAARHRIAYIDGLRAVAVLLVVAYHMASSMSVNPSRTLLVNIAKHGSHGIELFFVLSGFCLSYPTLAALRRDGSTLFDTVRYAAHRIVRIVPAYWLAIVALGAFYLVLLRNGVTLPDTLRGFSVQDLVQQLLFVDSGTKFLNGSFWTLPVEFRWYFAFPILLYVWTKWPKAFIGIAIVSLLFAPTAIGDPDMMALPAFILGIVAADLCVKNVRLGAWPAIATGVLLIVALLTTRTEGWRDVFNPAWYLLAFAFVVWAGSSRTLDRVLSLRGLAWIGVASYSIYLVHQPIIAFAESRGVNPLLAGIIGVAVGFAFWAVAERPFIGKTATRAKLLSEFGDVFEKWFPRVGLGRSVSLVDMPQVPKDLTEKVA